MEHNPHPQPDDAKPDHKFSAIDQQFHVKRKDFFGSPDVKALEPMFVVDNWPLFTGAVGLAKVLARFEIVKKTLDVPGHILEFGVNNGAGLHTFAKVLHLLSPHSYKRCYGFDSFQGLQNFSKEDQVAARDFKGRYRGDENLLLRAIRFHGMEDAVKLIHGDIENTLPEFLEKNACHMFSLVNIDVDVYPATKLILEKVWPRVAVGGLIILDEGYSDVFPGEGQALFEFLAKIPGRYKSHCVPFAREPMMYIEKLS